MVLMIHHALTHIISHVSRGHRVFWVLTHCTPSPRRPSQGWSGLGWCLHGSSSATAVFRPFQLPQLLLAFPPEGPCNAQEVGLGSPVTCTGDGLRHCVTNDSDTLGIGLVTDPTMTLTRPWPDPACPSCLLPHPDCCSGPLLIHTHPHFQLEQLSPPPPTPDLLVATWLTNSLRWSLDSAWSAATCVSHFLSLPQFLHQPLLDPQTLLRMNEHMNSFYAAERKCPFMLLKGSVSLFFCGHTVLCCSGSPSHMQRYWLILRSKPSTAVIDVIHQQRPQNPRQNPMLVHPGLKLEYLLKG